ncbi:NAD(P)/FAD-dependent oxidoreductase [Clostridium cellulovorans]|uniref:FAD dependent oxidoreductase n=1 Tax=Clostridium cellulovorans (strain ATCC 35296 / DSM 3052 / OCM 3 / 743B) TaxID=573061 RepID=D9SML7_CLOC7|nr:FAD-dependent oxidoreductase [Clostridium cellulovorans]ADL49802.1 FAD dependent oxidoreductase [Clostridium cellulovorans 743B]
MDYDVLILGGGIFGCAIAYELSKYSLNIAVIEKEYDIATDIEIINSTIVFDGTIAKNDIMSTLEQRGNVLIKELAEKFNLSYQPKDMLYLAYCDKEAQKLQKTYEDAVDRGIENIELINSKKVAEVEPNLKKEVINGILSRNTGIIEPYDLALALAEVAFDNGVNFRFNEKVLSIETIAKGSIITTTKNKFKCKMVINTIPQKNYDIEDNLIDEEYKAVRRKINYFLMENEGDKKLSNIMLSISENNQISVAVPNPNSTVGAIIHDDIISMREAKDIIKKQVKGIRNNYISAYYSDTYYSDTIIINDSYVDKGYIKISGKNYSEVTMTPAIAKIISETIRENIKCTLKKDYTDKRRDIFKFRDLSNEERQELIDVDKKYGNIVCYCNKVSEGEIVDAIRRPLGARTVEGVKRRTGAMQGSCKGATCLHKIVNILARELNRDVLEIVKDTKDSNIIVGRMKEFDGI